MEATTGRATATSLTQITELLFRKVPAVAEKQVLKVAKEVIKNTKTRSRTGIAAVDSGVEAAGVQMEGP